MDDKYEIGKQHVYPEIRIKIENSSDSDIPQQTVVALILKKHLKVGFGPGFPVSLFKCYPGYARLLFQRKRRV